MTNHYGRECVVNIGTVQRFKPKGMTKKWLAVTAPRQKDFPDEASYLKALREHEALGAEITSKIPPALFGKEPTLDEVINGNPKKGYKGSPELATDPKYKPWLDTVSYLEGMVSTYGIHAAGIVLANEPVSDTMPIKVGKDPDGNERWATQFTMEEVEALGLTKVEIVGML